MVAVRTLGIDLASQPARTAVCEIEWREDGAVEIRRPTRGHDDLALVDAMREADAVGIDAPFGWPRFLIDNLPAYAHEGRWPPKPEGAGESWVDEIRYRETDRFVRSWTKEKLGFRVSPLSVSSDRIAYCAWRCAGLLHRHSEATDTALDRLGDRTGVFEGYPAAALAAWGAAHKGYKPGAAGSQKSKRAELCRARIVEHLATEAGNWLGTATGEVPLREALVREPGADDNLDALIGAIVARAAAAKKTIHPSDEQLELAREEGWIHLPLPGSLAELAS